MARPSKRGSQSSSRGPLAAVALIDRSIEQVPPRSAAQEVLYSAQRHRRRGQVCASPQRRPSKASQHVLPTEEPSMKCLAAAQRALLALLVLAAAAAAGSAENDGEKRLSNPPYLPPPAQRYPHGCYRLAATVKLQPSMTL